MSELTKAKRRIKQLEKCLQAVLDLAFERGYDLNAVGKDTYANEEFRFLTEVSHRINRTLNPSKQKVQA